MTQKMAHDCKGFHSGFVALVGAPNAGKSTLLNRLLGTKISITSRKPQTTRNRILGVVHRPGSQLVFIDTPGVHPSRQPLNVRIVDTALSALGEVDVALLMADAQRPDPQAEDFLIARLSEARKPVLLALNKIDGLSAAACLQLLDQWSARFAFDHLLAISALHGNQVDRLLQVLESMLP